MNLKNFYSSIITAISIIFIINSAFSTGFENMLYYGIGVILLTQAYIIKSID